MVVGLLAEHILFLQGIALAERLHHVGEYILKSMYCSASVQSCCTGLVISKITDGSPLAEKGRHCRPFPPAAHKGR